MTVVLDINASARMTDFGRRTTNGDTVTATTEVGSPPDLFPYFFSFLAVSPYLQIWCMEIVSEGLLFIEIFVSVGGRL